MTNTIQIITSGMRKKGLIALITVFAILPISQAKADCDQGKPDKRAKIEELRKKYFNEKLSLSETEQKGFWPLYNEYKQKEKALRDSFKSKYKSNDVIFMDDKQAEAYLEATIKLKEDQTALYKTYIAKFKKVIPVKKVAMLPLVEREFKKEIFKQARQHHKPGEQHPPAEDPDDE